MLQAIARGRLTAARSGSIWLVAEDDKFQGFSRKPSGRRPKDRKPAMILRRIHTRLASVYGGRLHGVVLYGSEARGEAMPDSDIDVLVLLRGPIAYGHEVERIIRALYQLDLEWRRPIHAQPVDVRAYESGECALYRNAKSEGILCHG